LLWLGLAAVAVPGAGAGLQVSAAGVLLAAVIGVLGVGLAPPQGRVAAGLRVLGLGLVPLLAAAGVMVALEDPQAFALAHRRPVTARGVVLRVPARMRVIPELREPTASPWPLHPGLHDALAQRVGDR